jgi:hypothetical protein
MKHDHIAVRPKQKANFMLALAQYKLDHNCNLTQGEFLDVLRADHKKMEEMRSEIKGEMPND